MRDGDAFDVVAVGGGPAGLNAALVLGRARRRVLVCDDGHPRNQQVPVSHGFLTRDGTPGAELREIATQQALAYPGVEIACVRVGAVSARAASFDVTFDDGRVVSARRILLCTGVVDELPDIAGLAERWGRSVVSCPYCDGWEVRDLPLAVIGSDGEHAFLACHLTRWTDDVVLCTNGIDELDGSARALLEQRGVAVHPMPIARLAGAENTLERIEFHDGTVVARAAAFLHPPMRDASDIADQLGCARFDDGSLQVDEFAQTSVAGVFAAGDCCRRAAMPKPAGQIVSAAAQGSAAAIAIDQLLFLDELGDGARTHA